MGGNTVSTGVGQPSTIHWREGTGESEEDWRLDRAYEGVDTDVWRIMSMSTKCLSIIIIIIIIINFCTGVL